MVNINDVARCAGVSAMTVSRVVNNTGKVTEKTRQRVLNAINQLNYIPNQIARSLAVSESRTVGVLFSNLFNPAYTSILFGIEQRAKEFGYNVMISNAPDYETSLRSIDMLFSHMVEGLIILPLELANMNEGGEQSLDEMKRFYDYLREMLAKRNLPCVIIDIDVGPDVGQYVCHDFAGSSKIAMEYLLGKGFQNIYHISSELKAGLWQERSAAYQAEMERAGLSEYAGIGYCENSTFGSYRLVRTMLEQGRCPEVFYCANDILAIGAMQAVSACGLRIPQDISVMGNDGIYIGEMLVPALTTVSINSQEVGRKSMECCFDIIEHKIRKQRLVVPAELLVRNSVGEKR